MSITKTANLTKLKDTASALTTAARARRLTVEQLSEAINLFNVHGSEFASQSCGLEWLRAFTDASPHHVQLIRSQINMYEVYRACAHNPRIALLFDEPLFELFEEFDHIQLALSALGSMVHITSWFCLRARKIGISNRDIANALATRLEHDAPDDSITPYVDRTINILLDGAGQWATAGHKNGRMQWTFDTANGVWSTFDDDLQLHSALVRCVQLQPEKLLTPKRLYPEEPTMTERLMSRFGSRSDGKKLVSEIFFEAAKAMPTLTALPPEALLELSGEHQLALIHQFDGCSLPYLIGKAASLTRVEHRFSMFDQYATKLCEQAGESLPDIFCALQPTLADVKDREFAAHVEQRLIERLRRLGYVVATLEERFHKNRRQLVAFYHNGYANVTYVESYRIRPSGLKAGDRVIFSTQGEEAVYLAKYVWAVRFRLVPGGRSSA